MFAKCLYNRELEFASKNLPPSIECIDSLIRYAIHSHYILTMLYCVLSLHSDYIITTIY
jgi:hypothetical protein